MDNKSTHEFVEDLHERQQKDQKNKEHQSRSHQSQQLPNKQHSKRG